MFNYCSVIKIYQIVILLFLTETKVITEIDCPDGSSLSVVDVNKNFIAFVKSSVIKPQQLLISKFDFEKINSGTLTMTECSKPVDILEGENIMYEHTEVVLSNSDAVSKSILIFIFKIWICILLFILNDLLTLVLFIQRTLILHSLERRAHQINLCP